MEGSETPMYPSSTAAAAARQGIRERKARYVRHDGHYAHTLVCLWCVMYGAAYGGGEVMCVMQAYTTHPLSRRIESHDPGLTTFEVRVTVTGGRQEEERWT